MKFINVTKENFKDFEDMTKEIEEDLQSVLQYLKDYNFTISEEASVVFCNHLMMMITRFQEKELASVNINESVIEQLQPECLEMSKEVLQPLYEKYQLSHCLVEEVLLAIYFQTNMKKEEQLCQTNH